MAIRVLMVAAYRIPIVALVVMLVPAGACAQATMSIPTNLTVAPGGTVNIPVNLLVTGNFFDAGHGNGISGVSFVISYNTSLPVTVGTFSLGSLIATPSYGFNGYVTNNTSGFIRASSISNPP